MTSDEYKSEVARLRPQLMATARRYLGDSAAAEDAVQDVLLRLWQMLPQLNMPMSGLATILTRNFCIDQRRRQKPTTELPDTVADSNTTEMTEQRQIERMMRIVEQLPDMQQTVLRLRHMDGMSMSDIAQLTGSTETALRKALSRARQAVRERYMTMAKTNER